jgi:hypothetical protein
MVRDMVGGFKNLVLASLRRLNDRFSGEVGRKNVIFRNVIREVMGSSQTTIKAETAETGAYTESHSLDACTE